MSKFAANLSILCSELPFLQQFEAAARDGFEAVEFLSRYSFSALKISA
jgi:hydroxypyruvate isomerase